MGMFDTIQCKYKLPLPENPNGYIPFTSYQTKDLDQALDVYELREDGTLWRQNLVGEWKLGDPKGKSISDRLGHFETHHIDWQQTTINHSINLFGYEQTDGLYDYVIEYDVKFTNGVVTDVQLIRFETRDNTERKRRDETFIRECKMRRDFEKTIRYKFIYTYWNIALRFTLRNTSKLLTKIRDKIQSLELKLTI